MARPTREQRKLNAADRLYEACKIAEMRIKGEMERRPKNSKERKADIVVLKIIEAALYEYEGPVEEQSPSGSSIS